MINTSTGTRTARSPESRDLTGKMKQQDINVTIKETADMIYTDQTGYFPVVFSQGHKYIMILVKIDGNYIAME